MDSDVLSAGGYREGEVARVDVERSKLIARCCADRHVRKIPLSSEHFQSEPAGIKSRIQFITMDQLPTRVVAIRSSQSTQSTEWVAR